MKNIFRFFGVVALFFFIVGQSFAVNYKLSSGAKVRFAIEKLKIPQADADVYAAQGYVDLWTYALFNKGHWEQATNQDNGNSQTLIGLTDGKVTTWSINITAGTHSYWICDKSGNFQTSGSIMFAGPFQTSTCGAGRHEQTALTKAIGPEFVNGVCPTYAYSASSSATTLRTLSGESTCAEYVDIWTDEDGVEWYRLKLYQIRYEYPKVNGHGTTFYTRFYCSNSASASLGQDPMISNGASTLQASYYNTTSPIFGVDNWNSSDADWSHYHRANGYDYSSDLYGYVIGGVEVISGMEAELAAEAACWGTDVSGRFNVTSWGGNDWSKYTKVTATVKNASGTLSKDLEFGTDIVFGGTALCNAAGRVTATGEEDAFAFTLTPSGYTLPGGTPADSLIWVIEDTFLA